MTKLEAIRTVSGDDRSKLMFRGPDDDWTEATPEQLPALQRRIKRRKGEVIFTGEYVAYSKALGKHGAVSFLYFAL